MLKKLFSSLTILCIGTSVSAADDYSEIVVKARKRAENTLQVPISITPFQKETLQNPIVNDISDIAKEAPNVDFITTAPFAGSSNAASVYIRGIGQNDFLLTTDPAIGIYLDGVYIARSIGGVLKAGDLESVEILNGPQGTLFGKNSIGGAIQAFSRKPSAIPGGELVFTTGSYHRHDFGASIEGSLRDNVQGRLSFLSENRDGYVDRLYDDVWLGDIDRLTGKGVLTWQVNETTDIFATVDRTHQRQEAIAQHLRTFVVTPTNTTFNAEAPVAWDASWLTNDPFTTYQTGPSQDDVDVTGFSLTATHRTTWGEITSISGYRTLDATYARDPDGSPVQYGHSINTDDQDQFSQELRFQGNALEDRLDWLVGLYYFEESGHNRTDGFLFSDTSVGLDFIVNNDIDTKSYAVFTQNIYQLSEKANVTFGIRATFEEKTFSVDTRLTNGFIITQGTDSDDWTNLSPMASVDYTFDNGVFTYLTASRGFKSGGYNGRQVFPGPVDKFEPEFATTIEAGLKTKLLDDTLSLEASVFTTDYEDMQFTVLVAGVIPQIANAAEARINGAELSIDYKSDSPFSLSAGIGYLNAKYTRLDADTFLTKDLSLVRTPKWNAHIKPSYLWFSDSGDWELSALLRYKSKVYNDALNTDDIAQGGFTTLDITGTWYSIEEDWTLQAFVTNATDKRYYISGSSDKAQFGASEVNYARPREYGFRVKYQF